MGEKLIVGPVNRGFTNNREPFVIDNDSFPALVNAYQWRGRIKRKRGTSLLGRLQRFFNSNTTLYNLGSTFIVLNGSGAGNILTGFGLEANGNIVPGSVQLTDQSDANQLYTDLLMNGTLQGTTGGTGTINYATEAITITEG